MPFFSRNKKSAVKEGSHPTVKPPERVLPVVEEQDVFRGWNR